MNLIEGALFWAEAGVPVFPCAGDKRPLTENGFYDAEVDPAKVRALFEFYGDSAKLIGARMGKDSGMFCMDFDLYKGDVPKNYMQHLMDEGALPDSRIHRTMNGGLHVFYYSDTDWPNTKPCEGVEVKGEGGYVIVPPSPGYEIVSDIAIADAPTTLISELHKARDVASSATIDQLKAAILTATDFHDSIRGITARMSARGYPPEDILLELKKLLSASDAAHEDHPRHSRWLGLMRGKSQELSRMVLSSYSKYNPNAATEKVREYGNAEWSATADKIGFAHSPSEGNSSEPAAKVYRSDEWPFTDGYFGHEDYDLTEQNFTMYPIFAENETVVMFAEPKVGKTAVSLTTALHIACGMDLGDLKVSEAGPTLYYALEGTRAIRLRVAAWRKMKREAGVELPEVIPLWVEEGHANFFKEERRKDEANKIIAANTYSINNGYGPLKAIYLDTLTKAMSGGDQNSVEDTSHLFDLVGLLRSGGVSATIVFVHHKARQGNVRGSSNIEAEPDVLLDVTKADASVIVKIARARSIEDGDNYVFKLVGVDLGITKQGFKLQGVYAEPELSVADAANDVVGEASIRAKRLKIILNLGVGEHKLPDIMNAFNKYGLGIGKESRNAARTKRQFKEAGVFMAEFIGNTGRVFSDHAFTLVRNIQEEVVAVNVSPLGE